LSESDILKKRKLDSYYKGINQNTWLDQK